MQNPNQALLSLHSFLLVADITKLTKAMNGRIHPQNMSNGETSRKIDRFCIVNRYAARNGDQKAGPQERPDHWPYKRKQTSKFSLSRNRLERLLQIWGFRMIALRGSPAAPPYSFLLIEAPVYKTRG